MSDESKSSDTKMPFWIWIRDHPVTISIGIFGSILTIVGFVTSPAFQKFIKNDFGRFLNLAGSYDSIPTGSHSGDNSGVVVTTEGSANPLITGSGAINGNNLNTATANNGEIFSGAGYENPASVVYENPACVVCENPGTVSPSSVNAKNSQIEPTQFISLPPVKMSAVDTIIPTADGTSH